MARPPKVRLRHLFRDRGYARYVLVQPRDCRQVGDGALGGGWRVIRENRVDGSVGPRCKGAGFHRAEQVARHPFKIFRLRLGLFQHPLEHLVR
jgi:hypothetical protein